MRVKQLWDYLPLPAKLKLVYNRLTLSHVTTAYFALALVHCLVQVGLQSHAFLVDDAQSAILRDIVHAGNVTEWFAVLDSDEYVELCRSVPGQTSDPHPCITFSGVGERNKRKPNDYPQEPKNRGGSQMISPRAPVFTGNLDDNGHIHGVTVTGLDGLETVTISGECTQVLAWPDQIVNQGKREALAMVAFQVWLFGVSLLAILNESIPHVLAALATHILSTGWASFQMARTKHFEDRFSDIVTSAACNGVDLMPTYWRMRLDNQIPILVLNVASLLVSFYLSWKLYKQYGVQSLNRVGASPRMYRLYVLVLVLSVSLQLTAFFLVTALALWIEQLTDGPIARLAKHRHIYLGVFIGTISLILPWLYMGWTAVRRERRHMMHIFLFTSLLLIAAQTGMFISAIYRLTFHTWTFFGTLTVAAYVLLVATFVMAIVCRISFGNGLAHFLRVQDALEDCDFTPVYFERDGNATEKKEPLPWDSDGDTIVRTLSHDLTLERKGVLGEPTTGNSLQDDTRPPLLAKISGENGQIRRPRAVHFIGDEDIAAPRPANVPQENTPSPAIDDRSPAQGHKRDSSSGTWYNYPRGRELITRGVNTSEPRGPGIPKNVRPSKRPPGLAISIPANTYAVERI